jgi:hypothetical protein
MRGNLLIQKEKDVFSTFNFGFEVEALKPAYGVVILKFAADIQPSDIKPETSGRLPRA